MRKLLLQVCLGLSLLSWILLFLLSLLYFSPTHALRIVHGLIPSEYNFSFSALKNRGTILRPILKFSDLQASNKGIKMLEAEQSEIGITLLPDLLLGNVKIAIFQVNNAYFFLEESLVDSSSGLNFSLDKNILLDIKDLTINTLDSKITIHANFKGLLPGLANGQANFIHKDQVSTFSVGSDGVKSNFSLNLSSFHWLRFFSQRIPVPIRSIEFGVNLVGSLDARGSSVKGALHYETKDLNSMILKKNYGSFSFQSSDKFATLSLNKFLHPFIDEKFPIKFNLFDNSIEIPKLYLSDQIFTQKQPRFSNLVIHNLIATYKKNILNYSGEVIDLDLKDIYFEEIINLQGSFAGKQKSMKFSINPTQSFVKRLGGKFYPLIINGKGSLNSFGLNIETNIKEQEHPGMLALKLNLSNKIGTSLVLQISGKNLSQQALLSFVPSTLEDVHHFISSKVKLNSSNNIFLNYSTASLHESSDLSLKLSIGSAEINVNKNLKFLLDGGLIEINNNNLYMHSFPGTANKFPLESFQGKLNFSDRNLQYISMHDISGQELSGSLGISSDLMNKMQATAASKGFYNFSSSKSHNSLSIETSRFNLPIFENYPILLDAGQLFALNFDTLFGNISSQLLDQNSSIILHGRDLRDIYKLDFISQLFIEPSNFLPNLSFLELNGQDNFNIALSLHKGLSPSLAIDSQLRGISFISNLPFLQKSKLSILPTNIIVNNLTKPEIFLKNDLVELKIQSLDSIEGYVAIGSEIPSKYSFIKQAKGLNLYLGLQDFNSDILSNISLSEDSNQNIDLTNVIFDIARFTVLENEFNQINGEFFISNLGINGTIQSDNFNGIFATDRSGFLKIELQDTHFENASFLDNQISSGAIKSINARLIARNSSLEGIKIKSLDAYILKNENVITLNNINLDSNLMSISPIYDSSNAYFSFDSQRDVLKLRGQYMIKDSSKIPILREHSNFSYFNGDINLQWKNFTRLQDIEGSLSFILKDLILNNTASNATALSLLGVFNLKNILGKVANLDLTIKEFTSTKLNRVQGDLIFSQSKARLAAPLFIETNAAKMKWIGQINKNGNGELNNLDLGLDLRIRIGENIPWYAAILGGIPAIAGSAIISEIFETNIDDLSNYQYEVFGTLVAPEINRIN